MFPRAPPLFSFLLLVLFPPTATRSTAPSRFLSSFPGKLPWKSSIFRALSESLTLKRSKSHTVCVRSDEPLVCGAKISKTGQCPRVGYFAGFPRFCPSQILPQTQTNSHQTRAFVARMAAPNNTLVSLTGNFRKRKVLGPLWFPST